MLSFLRAAVCGLVALVWAAEPSPWHWDLISPANCRLKFGRLQECSLPDHDLPASTRHAGFIPFKTVVRTVVEGNCSTPYPLTLRAASPSDKAISGELSIVRADQAVLRARDGGPLGGLQLRDSSPWTRQSSLAASCFSKVEVQLDLPDIDAASDAAPIAQKILDTLSDTQAAHAAQLELQSYRAAFRALHALAGVLDTQVRNAAGTELQTEAKDLDALLDRMKGSAGLALTAAQKQALAKLQDFLALLQDEDWRRTNANRTVADYFSKQDREQIERLAKVDPDAGKPALAASEKRLAKVCVEAREAAADLKEWLTPKEMDALKEALKGCPHATR